VLYMMQGGRKRGTPNVSNKLIERFTLSAQTKSVISALLLDKEEDWARVRS